jgi:alpha/beta superfamily hydrolase
VVSPRGNCWSEYGIETPVSSTVNDRLRAAIRFPIGVVLSTPLLAACLFLPPVVAQPAASVKETYAGGYGVPGDFVYTAIDLATSGGVLTGKIRQPYDRENQPTISDVTRDGSRLIFNADNMAFDLQRTKHGYSGFVIDERGRRRPAAFIVRPKAVPTDVVATYEGTYQIARGRTVTLSRNVASPALYYLELPSGRTGFLFNVSDTEYIAGYCIYCAGPEYLHVWFRPATPGSRVNSFAAEIGGRKVTARRVTTYREEEVTFKSADGTLLTGSLFLPFGTEAHPAVVFAHGSSAQTRNGYYGYIRFQAEAYARKGIAALAFDKRGTGKSQGDWEKASLVDLGKDVAAGVRYLRTRSDIHADRIGLTGGSQAGWIMPLATRDVPDVRFIQQRSAASALGLREQERLRIILQMQFDKYPQSEIDRAVRIRDMMDDYAASGEAWDELATEAKKVENENWMKTFIGGFPARDAPDWAWLRENFAMDPVPDIVRFRGSWQVLYGGKDPIAPLQVGKAALVAALRRGNSRDVTIEIMPSATHNYLEAKIGSEREFPGLSRMVPGFFDTMVNWAAERFSGPTSRHEPGKFADPPVLTN